MAQSERSTKSHEITPTKQAIKPEALRIETGTFEASHYNSEHSYPKARSQNLWTRETTDGGRCPSFSNSLHSGAMAEMALCCYGWSSDGAGSFRVLRPG